uniref:Uncharacterized protein n=1 Tax=Megaselia scalaris TaxID=36166 RepID=T1GEA2_MEGSC
MKILFIMFVAVVMALFVTSVESCTPSGQPCKLNSDCCLVRRSTNFYIPHCRKDNTCM